MGARGPKPTGKTPGRNIRVDDELWTAAKEVASERGSSANAEIVAFLRRMVAKAEKSKVA